MWRQKKFTIKSFNLSFNVINLLRLLNINVNLFVYKLQIVL